MNDINWKRFQEARQRLYVRIEDPYCGTLRVINGFEVEDVDCGTIDPCVLANIGLIEKRGKPVEEA